NWTESEELASLEHEYGVETDLDEPAAYEQDGEIAAADAEHFNEPEDLYPNDGYEPNDSSDVAAYDQGGGHDSEPQDQAEPQDEPAQYEQPQEEPQEQ